MLRAQFTDALKAAMRAKDGRATSTLRMILAALKDKDIAARGQGNADGIDDASIMSMLQTMVRQRQESAELYDKGDRPELAAQEREEIVLIEGFLPKAMSAEEAEAAVAAVIGELGAASIKDMGKVMAELRARYAGRMDFGKASGVIKSKLTGG
jgi:uncharacterized protein